MGTRSGGGRPGTLGLILAERSAPGGSGGRSRPQASQAPRGVNAYMQEPMHYGGVQMTRGEVIADLRSQGATPAMIDRYMQGYELGQRLQAEHDARVKQLADASRAYYAGLTPEQHAAADTADLTQRAAMTPQQRLQERIGYLRGNIGRAIGIAVNRRAPIDQTMIVAMRRELARYERGTTTPPRPSATPRHETAQQKAYRLNIDYWRQEVWMNQGPGLGLTGTALQRAAARRSEALGRYAKARAAWDAERAGQPEPLLYAGF